jgi:PAS domain S-box-containing protein
MALFRRLTSAEATSRRRFEELTAVQRVGAASTSTLTLDQVLRQIYEQVRQLIPLDAFCLALYDRVTDDLRMELIVEEDRGQPPFTVKATDSAGLTARVVRSRQPLRINDLEAQRELRVPIPQQTSQAAIHSWLGLPLMVQDRVVGALSIQSYRANAFTAEHERLLATIAAQAAIAIENARLSQDLRVVRECYRTLIENSQDAILIETEDDEILDANPQACKLLGYSLGELLGLRVPDLQAPEVRGQMGHVVKSELAHSDQVFESLHLHSDGRRIPVEISVTRIARGSKGLAFVILRDMTGRKCAKDTPRQTTAG